jgi:hypothetical protein
VTQAAQKFDDSWRHQLMNLLLGYAAASQTFARRDGHKRNVAKGQYAKRREMKFLTQKLFELHKIASLISTLLFTNRFLLKAHLQP